MTDAAAAPAEAENIAVCIRVRPLNERETRAQDSSALRCVPALNAVALTDPATGAPLAGKGGAFQYDHIFDAGSDARAIYARVAQRIVRSTLGGINGTVFAYGQTSSGKTFTMQGDGGMPFEPEAESCRPGLLQLAVEDIFGCIERCADRDFLLRVSFLEIYNEVVRDLLGPSDNLKLREDPRKGVYVECHEQIITNYEDIVTLLQTGNRNRTVGHTAMNDKSSRSHSVFRIVIESKHKGQSAAVGVGADRRLSEEDVDGAVLVASLNLVDLAGSESLRHTGNEGIRQREAGNINKSLLTLARVINALASAGGQNAPFRDSKLTRLLQNSLGGNTRTLIVCCVTPSDRYIEETKSTLQFAARAKDIKQSATVNEVLDDQTQLRRLKREVNELKKLVNSEALNALKAENEALLSEKNHNKTEMARLKGLILSSSSVAKAAVEKKRKHRGKRTRETWGPGDFPPSIKTQAPLSPHRYPRKRHSVAKENQDPQTLFRVYEDGDESATKDAGNSPFHAAVRKVKSNQAGLGVKESSKQVLDLFAAVLRNCRDENVEDPMAAIEALANEKSASLGDIERARAFDVLADIRTLMVENMQSRAVLDEKLALEQELKDLRAKLNENPASFDCSENAPKAGALVEEIMAELESTQEALATEKKRCQDLETEKTNSQHMAAEELDAIQSQLETLKLQSNESQQRFDHEKRQLQATIESLQSELPQAANDGEYFSLRSKMDELESLLEEMKASRTVLQLAVAERDEEISSLKQQHNDSSQLEQESRVNSLEEEKTLLQQKIVELEQQVASTTDNAKSDKPIENAVVEKLAGELQNIMQELAQLQSDHERAALEKQELQADAERMSEELEISQRQGYEMSETLMQKEHIAKVLQAQLDAKLMTISQMQQRLETESKQREKLQLDVQSYEETLSVLRKEAKDSSVTIADLLEKMKMLETDLDSAARTQESKDEELASLTDALARSKEEQQEMRLQSKQRLVAAEGKEMALEEKISALEQQLTMNSNGVVQMELIESREKQTELQTKVATLENQLTEAREEQIKQDDVWNKKQAMAEREFARFTAEQKRLREELTALHSNSGASKQELEARAEELQKTKQSCTEILEQKQLVQEKLESTNAAWDEKQQELVLQMDSIREQFQEAQNELEEYQKNADGEIHRLRSVIEEANAEIEELKCSAKAKEEEFESQIGKQGDWQIQVKNRQEALQAKCDELDDERRLLKEKYAVLEAERGGVEEQLQNEILELSEKCASAQAQQATYQGKLKEMEAQLEMTENDAGKYRKEFESLAKSLKSSQVEAVEYHNQLVEAQLAKESMKKLVEKQKARIDKLEKVKMTTETLDLFRKLKKDRHDLQVKVQELQNDLAQAEQVLTQYQENHQEKEQRLVEDKDEELKLLKEHVEELRNALRAETQRAADMKAEMRAALSDEREKAEHEIQEMQALVKEKMELVEKLEAQVASVQDAMVKLQEHKSENVAYLEKENLDLHVENRELKKQLESALSPPEKDELMGDTGTFDASAAAAARALAEDNDTDHLESSAHVVSDGDDLNDAPSQPQEAETTRAGGFLLSTNELDAIAAQSQEDPHDGERPECSQQ